MTVFFVVSTSNPTAAGAAVAKVAPGNFRVLKSDAWFLDFQGTSQELAGKVGFLTGESGGGVVVPVTTYSGRAPADIWEWITQRMSKAG